MKKRAEKTQANVAALQATTQRSTVIVNTAIGLRDNLRTVHRPRARTALRLSSLRPLRRSRTVIAHGDMQIRVASFR